MMNYKAALKYQIEEYKKPVIAYYVILVCLLLFFIMAFFLFESSTFDSTGGLEFANLIFLFVIGMNSFKESFFIMLQNSISRKTMFVGRIISMLVASVIMAAIDRIIVTIFSSIDEINERFHIVGLYEQIVPKHADSVGQLQGHMEALILTTLIFLVGTAAGYLITAAYYRMNKAVKLAVSIGVPVGLLVVIPLTDVMVLEGRISRAIGRILDIILCVGSGTPYGLMLSSSVSFLILLGLSWLLIRKATDK